MSTFRSIMAGAALLAALLPGSAAFAEGSTEAKPAWDAIRVDTCSEGFEKPSMHCSATVAGAFDASGRFWATWSNDGRVYVNSSDDEGQSFSAPVPVNAAPQSVDNNGENRPKLAIGPEGEIYATYIIRAKKKYTGDLYFSRSLDGGNTFEAAHSLNDSETKNSLRFEALGVSPDGTVYVSWLDKRDLFLAKSEERLYSGSAIYYGYSTDQGATFSANTPMAHHTCECCRVFMDMDKNGLPAVVWRHIFDTNTRDHAIMRFAAPDQPGEVGRLSTDNWAVDSCPHHGPSISIDEQEVFHTTWFTSGDIRQGAYYARSTDGGDTFIDIRAIGNGEDQSEHPIVLANDGDVYLLWKDFDGENTRLRLSVSSDHGKTWSPDQTVATTNEGSDHPLLAVSDAQVFATWSTEAEGFRVIALEGI